MNFKSTASVHLPVVSAQEASGRLTTWLCWPDKKMDSILYLLALF